jgi:hypothetical protein
MIFCDIYMIMGINIILTEAQVANLEKTVGKAEVVEMKVSLACTNMNYDSLVDFLDGRPEKKLGHNTIVHMVRVMDSPEDQVAVKYHGTNIIKIDKENVVTLDNGGWDTPTTKDRLNQFLRCRGGYIFQEKGKWYYKNEYGKYPFARNMQILPNGTVAGADDVDPSKIPTYLKKMKSLDIDPKYKELYGIE